MSIDPSLLQGVVPASHAELTFELPDFWDPRKAYVPFYMPDLDAATIRGYEFGRRHGLDTVAKLEQRGISNLMMLTDLQQDFRDKGRLPVTGTDNVVLRTCVRLLNGFLGTDYYTRVVFSQDTHPTNHISHSTRWLQVANGQPLDLSVLKAATLELEDEQRRLFRAKGFDDQGNPVDLGLVRSRIESADTVSYWHHLQDTGQGPIWVFATHCKIGSDGMNLHPLLQETLAFIEGARLMEPLPMFKGHLKHTDWFGPFEPCRPDTSHPQGGLQRPVIEVFERVSGWVEFAGVAEDFCDFYAKDQVINTFQGTDFFAKMAFLPDLTAPIVPNSQKVQDLNARAASLGVRFVKHDEPFTARV